MISPLISVIIPCRNEHASIVRTLESVVSQRSDDGRPLAEWGEVLVLDDESTDGTSEVLAEFQRRHPFVRVLRNEPRRGLAGSYNRGIQEAQAPLLLMCHSDCQLQGNDYLRRMMGHFSDPKVAAVTGKPVLLNPNDLSFAEKTYFMTHLMDVGDEPPTVRQINFAEGRCDGFRKQALLEIGLYDEKTRIAGEDQVVAIQLRQRGYQLLQDTALHYTLSCGSSQNTQWRIIRRQMILGQGQVFVIIKYGFGTDQMAKTAPNRRRRKRLRVLEIFGVPAVLVGTALIGWRAPFALWWWIPGLVGLRLAYLVVENRGLFRFVEMVRMLPTVMASDVAYFIGSVRGSWRAWRGKGVSD